MIHMQKEQSQNDQITAVCEKTRAWLVKQNKIRAVEQKMLYKRHNVIQTKSTKKIYSDNGEEGELKYIFETSVIG